MSIDDDFLRELRATFVVEAREHLQTLSQSLIELEAGPQAETRLALLETVFRAAHSLKGAARTVDASEIESVCQLLEDVLARQQREQSLPKPEAIDVMHRALDTIGTLVAAMDGGPPLAPGELVAVRKEMRGLTAAVAPPFGMDFSASDLQGLTSLPPASPPVYPPAGRPAPASPVFTPPTSAHPATASTRPPMPPQASAPPCPSPSQPARLLTDALVPSAALDLSAHAAQPLPVEGTVRVALPKLEAQLRHTEELLIAKLTTGQRMADIQSLAEGFTEWRARWAGLNADARVLRGPVALTSDLGHPDPKADPNAQSLARVLDFCEWGDDALRSLEARLIDIGRAARKDHEFVSRSIDSALDNAKELLLLPFSTLSAPFPRLVRDLCRSEGKEADLLINGDHTELDKRILEEMKDPLVHMLRNAVDHAVEPAAVRVERGKPPRATIVLSVTQIDGHRVQITLTDDGAGIDTDRVRAAAVRSGALSAHDVAQLDESAAQALVFRSALSTGATVTPLSGRGLGLAIVQEHAQRLGGDVQVESTRGQGTRFRIVVPAVRATFRGILCEAAGRQFLLPASMVERVADLKPEALRSVEGREAVCIGERVLALVSLADVLELPEAVPRRPGTGVQVVVIGTGDQAVAFAVDAVLEEREVLVKPLRRPLLRVRNVAAAAVLGSGVLVPVLNTADLLKSARLAPRAGLRAAAARAQAPSTKTILVAEDSITSRLLLKTILQAAGYTVKTAVDGAEALAVLRSESIDLLVSDVEMPRLNGFDLTTRVRADRKLAELPVILVTALATREDKEHGIDVGANAYIVKGSFDQGHLLEAIERLI